jgi:hypothetical protein
VKVSKGAAVAGVAITGVVVGAFTAGIGLVPYLAVVGAAVAAGGGAVAYTASKTGASRIVMAAETEVWPPLHPRGDRDLPGT